MNTKITTIKKLTTLLILLLSLTACSSNKSKPTPKKSEAASYNARLGAEYTRKGRLNLANEKLLKALDQNPDSAEGFFGQTEIRSSETFGHGIAAVATHALQPRSPTRVEIESWDISSAFLQGLSFKDFYKQASKYRLEIRMPGRFSWHLPEMSGNTCEPSKGANFKLIIATPSTLYCYC